MLWCNGAATCFLRWDKPALYPLRRPNRSMSTESRPTADFVADAVKSQSPLPNSLSITYLLCKDFLGVNYVWCYQTNVLKQQDKENLRRSTESHLRRCFLAPSLWFFAKVRTGSLEEMPTSARGQLASTLTIRGRVEPHRTAPSILFPIHFLLLLLWRWRSTRLKAKAGLWAQQGHVGLQRQGTQPLCVGQHCHRHVSNGAWQRAAKLELLPSKPLK